MSRPIHIKKNNYKDNNNYISSTPTDDNFLFIIVKVACSESNKEDAWQELEKYTTF